MNEKSTLRKDANNYFTHKNRGITLIALVITIIVMLILVAVTINMAINGGLFEKAGKATAETKNAIDEEQKLANGAIEIDGVWYNSIDEYLNRQPTNGGEEENANNNYSVPVSEEDIAPVDIFNYEILNVPMKIAKITGIKSDYCNESINYIYDQENDYTSYYGIAPDKINPIDTLIIPATAEIDGELYEIVDVNISISSYAGLPSVKTIIYPNTIRRISYIESTGLWDEDGNDALCSPVEEIVLPSGITSIPPYFAAGCKLLEKVNIPLGVTEIGRRAFWHCESLKRVVLPRGLISLKGGALCDMYDLMELYIPDTLIDIDDGIVLNAVGRNSTLKVYYSGSESQWSNGITNLFSMWYNWEPICNYDY